MNLLLLDAILTREIRTKMEKDIVALNDEDNCDFISFDRVLHQYRQHVSGALWHIVTQEHCLLHHLQVLKDYFLLTNGSFYNVYLLELEANPFSGVSHYGILGGFFNFLTLSRVKPSISTRCFENDIKRRCCFGTIRVELDGA